jgi:hypothetical protein
MKSQVVKQLLTAEEPRAGMHKADFQALQAVLVLLGVVALSGVWFGPGSAYAAVAGRPTTCGCQSALGSHHRRCILARASPQLPYKWMPADRSRER